MRELVKKTICEIMLLIKCCCCSKLFDCGIDKEDR